MAFDAFCQVKDIDGESTDAGHEKWIELISYSHGLNQPGSAASATGGRSAERVNIDNFTITKYIDASTPGLALACCDGRTIKEVKIELCLASGDKHPYMTYFLTNAMVSSVNPSGTASAADRPTETVSFSFDSIEWTYTPMGTDGKAGSKIGPMGWLLVNNKPK